MKFIFTPDECDVVFGRVRWSVTVEAVVDGDVVAHTPYPEDDDESTCLTTQSSKVHPSRDVLRIDVRNNKKDQRFLSSETELVVVVRGVVDGCANKVIEWRGYLAPRTWETQAFESIDEGETPTLRLQVSGFCVMHATYTATFPRTWTGVRIGISAAGVQRALDEYIY